jgi:hypothetical protein
VAKVSSAFTRETRPPTNVPRAFQQNGCKSVKWEHAALMNVIEDASTKR